MRTFLFAMWMGLVRIECVGLRADARRCRPSRKARCGDRPGNRGRHATGARQLALQ